MNTEFKNRLGKIVDKFTYNIQMMQLDDQQVYHRIDSLKALCKAYLYDFLVIVRASRRGLSKIYKAPATDDLDERLIRAAEFSFFTDVSLAGHEAASEYQGKPSLTYTLLERASNKSMQLISKQLSELAA